MMPHKPHANRYRGQEGEDDEIAEHTFHDGIADDAQQVACQKPICAILPAVYRDTVSFFLPLHCSYERERDEGLEGGPFGAPPDSAPLETSSLAQAPAVMHLVLCLRNELQSRA